MPRDTIFAPASGSGKAAIAIVRISGPQTRFVVETIAGSLPGPRQATLRIITGPDGPIDRALLVWFPAPHSFTGEDCAEFHLHGSLAVVRSLLSCLSTFTDCRLAQPGEFARRAFEHGKMDLSEVEGLADLIDSETERQRKQALRQMEGGLSLRVAEWRQALLSAMALVESDIDFSDEGDIEPETSRHAQRFIEQLISDINHVLASARQGQRLREGIVVIVAGPPNAGKSTLVNALAHRDIAIVSPIAGTTRDLIEVPLDLEGLPVTLIDTAGLRESTDDIENQGIARARRRVAQADLGLWLMPPDYDGQPPSGPDWIRIRTKADVSQITGGGLPISVLTGAGMDQLRAHLKNEIEQRLGSGDALITRERQNQALTRALLSLSQALQGLKSGGATELIAEDLRLAARHFGEIIGVVGVEAMLDTLFAQFCIGK